MNIAILVIIFVLLGMVLVQYSDTFACPCLSDNDLEGGSSCEYTLHNGPVQQHAGAPCYGRSHNFCLSDINCEWNPYYDVCQGRTYNTSPYYGWYGYGWPYRRSYYRYPYHRHRGYYRRRPSWLY